MTPIEKAIHIHLTDALARLLSQNQVMRQKVAFYSEDIERGRIVLPEGVTKAKVQAHLERAAQSLHEADLHIQEADKP